MQDIIVIGGGAAGFFAAITAKSANPHLNVALLEKTNTLLAKVRVSGGGRCNVTHACFDPLLFAKNYPRGHKELVGSFHRFYSKHMIEWLEKRGVVLKTEADGRMFPITDLSDTIIQCFLSEAKKLNIEILLNRRIEGIEKNEEGFCLHVKEHNKIKAKKIILATGSNVDGYQWAQSLGHSIQSPVPSLFTFNIPDFALKELSGISFENVRVQLSDTSFFQTGPLLITHFGLSGPAVLKLSAWAARYLHERQYRIPLEINWLPQFSLPALKKLLYDLKKRSNSKHLLGENPFHFPRSFWKINLEQIESGFSLKKLHDIPFKLLDELSYKLHSDCYHVSGKSMHKEEFVTCGGITLKEVCFKTMESKVCKHLFFAGEILDIDGVTGGFNFQNAWTTGFLAGSAAAL